MVAEGSGEAPRGDEPYVEAVGLSKVYPTRQGPVRALQDISLTVRRGEFVSLLGPSGCGKSTFLMLAAGLLAKSSGSLKVNGREVTRPLTDLGIVFQSDVLLEWRTALQNVMLQAEARGLERRRYEDIARELLASMGLNGFERRFPHELSGGMRQRVALCRALLHDPPLLLMDEPFGALDALTRDQLTLDLQRLWNERRKTVAFITHSVGEAVFLSDRVAIVTPRPGRVDRVLKIGLPRPRTLSMRDSPQFTEYTREILDLFLARGVLREK